MRVSVVCILVLFLLQGASGQANPLGDTPSTEIKTFHARADADDTTQTYISLLPVGDDPDAYNGGVQSAGAGSAAWSWSFKAEPLPVGVQLDGAAQIHAEVHVGGSTSNGQVTLSWSLTADGETLATGSDAEVTFVAEYSEGTWDVAPELTDLPAGTVLEWTISGTGPRTGAFIGVGERGTHGDTGRPFGGDSHFTLPIVGVAQEGGALHAELDVPSFQHSFNEATTADYSLNASVDFAAGNIVVVGSASEGSAAYRVLDDAGAVVLEGLVDADTNATQAFADAAVGQWTFEVSYTDFIGNVGIEIREHEEMSEQEDPEPEGEHHEEPEDHGSEPAGNDTVDDGGGKESPALVWPVLALALLAIVRRR